MKICTHSSGCARKTIAKKLCQTHYVQLRRQLNADVYAEHDHRSALRKYKLTPKEYAAILVKQGGGCAICGTKDPGAGRKHFCVDHDHVTNNVRGLLCNNHNLMLGRAKDNEQHLLNAVAYLQSSRAKMVANG